MEDSTAVRLVELNHQFYQTFAVQFSASRQRLQPGVRRILDKLNPEARMLDLGCGNGELARELAQKGHTGGYTGIDFSAELLEEARQDLPARFPAAFLQRDLSAGGWSRGLPGQPYEAALAFAVLHHLPGEALRQQVCRELHAILKPGACFYLSVWQFRNSPRLSARIQPWSLAGLEESQLDPGDYLLDWRSGGAGLRYVHLFDEQSLGQLAASTGFAVQDTFYSDGEGGRLGLYQTWLPDLAARPAARTGS
jgi:SAM-dependent methyltransferase